MEPSAFLPTRGWYYADLSEFPRAALTLGVR